MDSRMRVRLTRKFANSLNGIDLRKARVGEVIELAASQAEMLIAEGWAEPLTERPDDRVKDRVQPRQRH